MVFVMHNGGRSRWQVGPGSEVEGKVLPLVCWWLVATGVATSLAEGATRHCHSSCGGRMRYATNWRRSREAFLEVQLYVPQRT